MDCSQVHPIQCVLATGYNVCLAVCCAKVSMLVCLVCLAFAWNREHTKMLTDAQDTAKHTVLLHLAQFPVSLDCVPATHHL